MSLPRPRAIVAIEGLALFAAVLRTAQIFVNPAPWYDRFVLLDRMTRPGLGLVLGVALAAVGVLIPFALAMWATRRRSRVAVWILVVWVVLLVVGYILPIVQYGFLFGLSAVFNITTLAAYIGAVVMAFTPSARRWFRRERMAGEIADDFV